MTAEEVLAWLDAEGDEATRAGMARYGIPSAGAFGVPMGAMKKYARRLGTDPILANALWATGRYEAQTIAVFVADPKRISAPQMDAWARDFNSWAICDTACFSLFDRTPFAWAKVPVWAADPAEFVRRAGYALVWSLSVHDKAAPDARFETALDMIANHPPDDRPLVKKAVDMALRATGKRNRALNAAAIAVAERLAQAPEKSRAWIGRHALRELGSEKTQARLKG